jgi:NitT/TauT family transport system substrate-binding protein
LIFSPKGDADAASPFFAPVNRCLVSFFLSLIAIIMASCSPADDATEAEWPLNEVVLQTDWFPQAEHGGFYQALAKGYYTEEGLDVTILPGGPNAMSAHKILRGTAHFAMNRADTILSMNAKGLPFQMVMTTLLHDAQGILVHQSSEVHKLEDLEGQTLMAVPGLMWVRWLKERYQIDFTVLPHDYSLQRFIADPDFIQQCLLTNEPFYVQQAGVESRVIPLSSSGFDPPHGIYAMADFLQSNPAIARAFIRASMRGWKDYMNSDPQPAFDLIKPLNPKMTQAFLEFSYGEMISRRLVTGTSPETTIGQLPVERLKALEIELRELGLLPETESNPEPTPWFTTAFQDQE